METISTPNKFRKAAERVLRAAHPDASIGFVWNFARRVKWADGSNGFSGTVEVTAPGYRTRTMIASYNNSDGLSVR